MSPHDPNIHRVYDAAYNNRLEDVIPLLNEGCDINEQLPNGWTPLMQAAHLGLYDMVALLLTNRADPLLTTKRRKTASDFAKGLGYTEIETLIRRAMGTPLPVAQAAGARLAM